MPILPIRPAPEKSNRESAGRLISVASSLLLALLCLELSSSAQAHKPSQDDVQAVYLFDFAHFVRWPPASPAGFFQICAAGHGISLETLRHVVAGERIDGVPVVVRVIDRPTDVTGCAVLFIGERTLDRIQPLLSATSGKPVLTVSDDPNFLRYGGMIQFVLADSRVRFSVDLTSVNRSGLSVSSELLKIAVSVLGLPGGGVE